MATAINLGHQTTYTLSQAAGFNSWATEHMRQPIKDILVQLCGSPPPPPFLFFFGGGGGYKKINLIIQIQGFEDCIII